MITFQLQSCQVAVLGDLRQLTLLHRFLQVPFALTPDL